MSNLELSFLTTLIASFSTLIGFIPVLFNIKNTKNIINASLSIAAGVMISVSLTSLLPESIELLSIYNNPINTILIVISFAILGLFMIKFLNIFLEKIDNKLYKLGIINMLALMIHNIPEGILTFATMTHDQKLGITIVFMIICHNIPEGISISIPIYYSTKSKFKAFIYTFISGISEFMGALLTYLFLYKYINNYFIGILLSLIIGIMIYIPIYELLPNTKNYNNKFLTIIFFIIGFVLMILIK